MSLLYQPQYTLILNEILTKTHCSGHKVGYILGYSPAFSKGIVGNMTCLDHVCKQKYLIDFNCDYLHCIIIISAIQFLSFTKDRWKEGYSW